MKRYSVRESEVVEGNWEIYCQYTDKPVVSYTDKIKALENLPKYNGPIETFKHYSREAHFTAKYPNVGRNLNYALLGLGGETGEILDKWKKVIRDRDGVVSPEVRHAMIKELGDVLWYLNETAINLETSLEEVAEINIDKLHSRLERNKIHGSGDNR